MSTINTVLAAIQSGNPASGSQYTPKPSKPCQAETMKVVFDNFTIGVSEDWVKCGGLSYSDDPLCPIHRRIFNQLCIGGGITNRKSRIRVPKSSINYPTCLFTQSLITAGSALTQAVAEKYFVDRGDNWINLADQQDLINAIGTVSGST